MHQIQLCNTACDGDPEPLVIEVYTRVEKAGGDMTRQVVLAVGETTTLILPPGGATLIREQAA